MPTPEPKRDRKRISSKTATLNGSPSRTLLPRAPHATIGVKPIPQLQRLSFSTEKTRMTTLQTRHSPRKPERSILRQSSGNTVSVRNKSTRSDLRPKEKLDTVVAGTVPTEPPPRLKLRKTKIAIALSQNAPPSIFTSGRTESMSGELPSNQVSSTQPRFELDPSFLNNEDKVSDNGREFDETSKELPIHNHESIDLNLLETESVKGKLPAKKTTIHYVLNVPTDRRRSLSTNDYNGDELTSDEEQEETSRGNWRSRSLQDLTPTKPLSKNPVIRHPQINSTSSLSICLFGHDADESVRWDPAVIAAGPIIQQKPKESETKKSDEEQVRNRDRNISGNDEIQACAETIRAWRKNDRKKIAQLLKALKESDFTDDENEISRKVTEPQSRVYITEIQSLDPRVPEFKSHKSIKTETGMKFSTPHPLTEKPHFELSWLKENTRPTPIAVCHKNKAPKKRVVIDDDSNPWCREVDFSSQWYSRMQLEEFMKKYPLTGQKAPLAQRKVSGSQTVNLQPMAKGRHAAAIQQRLEFLLLQEKERKAAARLAAQPPYFGLAPSRKD